MYKTEKELLDIKAQNLLIIEKKILHGEEIDNSINDYFSGITIIGNIDTFVWKWLPQSFIQEHEINFEEDQKLSSLEFALKYVNPNCISQYVKHINACRQKNANEPIELLENARTSEKMDYFWIHKLIKFSQKANCIITIAHQLTDMTRQLGHSEKFLGEEAFLRKNHFKYSTLSHRQKEVLKLLALGHVNDSVAQELNISPNTVRTYRNEIHKRLDLRWKNINHSQVYVQYATSFGLI